MNWLTQMVDRLDHVKPNWLLVANAVVALLILIAHGGALLMVRSGKGEIFGESTSTLYVSVPLAASAVALACAALIWAGSRTLILKIHAALLIGVAVYLLYYALFLISNGIPTIGRFTWDPVLFALFLAYPVYLARRVFVLPETLRNPAIKYAHVFALALSILLSSIIMWRIYAGAI